MALVSALWLAVATASTTPFAARPGIGDAAPALAQKDVRAKPGVPTEAPITIVEFFATWCAACQSSLRDTVDVLRTLDRTQAAARFKLVIVDVGENEATVKRWLEKTDLFRNTMVTLDLNKRAYAQWGADRLPTVFVIDKRGTIRHINRGHGKGYAARLSAWLAKRMAETEQPQ